MAELAQRVDEVLHKQHAQLLASMEAWLSRVEETLDKGRMGFVPLAPPGFGPSQFSEMLQVENTTQESESVELALPPERQESKQKDTPTHSVSTKTMRKTLQAHEYEMAQEEATRFESYKQTVTKEIAAPSDPSCCKKWAQAISGSAAFNIVVAFVIISNSVFLGMQLEWTANSGDHDADAAFAFLVGHVCYAVIFTVETSIRFVALGPAKFFCGPDCAWNWLDIFIVVPAWVELAVDMWGSASNFRIIRVFRVTRLLQLFRSIRLVRFISAFRELVLSVIDTVRQVFWAMVLLVLMIYSFGILFTDMSLQYVESNPVDEEMDKYFGSLYISCNTLFRALLEGFDWVDAAESLKPLGAFWIQLFHVYIAVGGLAILNVITGVFVNSAIKTREKDQETLLRHVQTFKQLVGNIWSKIDVNGLGQISISDFEELFQKEEMKAFFDKIEVSAVDAWTLFDSLDADGDHLVSYEDFTERCLQLHGTARSVDLFALKQQTGKLWDQLQVVDESQRETVKHLAWLMRAVASLLPEHCDASSRSNDEVIACELRWAEEDVAQH
ncbi:Scn11a [Symbiodinium sp. CCMP2592]|nr:Scn11a [Symbiodinium sp. CCMP2592]